MAYEIVTSVEPAANEKSRLTQLTANVTGKLWCGYRQGYGDAATGSHLVRGKRKAYMCANCMKLLGIASRQTRIGNVA